MTNRDRILKIAAEKLGIPDLDASACGIENLRHGVRDESWRVIVIGDGKPQTFDPDMVAEESVETRECVVTERDLREAA